MLLFADPTTFGVLFLKYPRQTFAWPLNNLQEADCIWRSGMVQKIVLENCDLQAK